MLLIPFAFGRLPPKNAANTLVCYNLKFGIKVAEIDYDGFYLQSWVLHLESGILIILNERLLDKIKNDASDDKVRTYFIRASVRFFRRGFGGGRFAELVANHLDYDCDVRRAFGGDDV